MDYLMANLGEAVDVPAFEKSSGIGVVVSADQIEEAVSSNMDATPCYVQTVSHITQLKIERISQYICIVKLPF